MSLLCTTSGIVLAAIATISAAIAYFVHRRFHHWQRLGIPFIKPSFPFGNFYDTFTQRKSFSERANDLYQISDTPSVGIFSGLIPTLLLRDPELIRTVLIRDFSHFVDRGVYCDEKREPLSGHLFALPGEKWRTLRQKLSPTFTSGKLKAMFQTIVDCGVPLASHVHNKAAGAGSDFEARELVAQYTTNVIASVAFGLDVDCIANPDSEFRYYGRKIFEPSVWNGVRNMLSFFFPPLLAWLGLKTVDNEVIDFFIRMVRQNLEHREQNDVSRKDFFQLLVQLRNGGVEADGVWKTSIAKDGVKQLSVEQCAAQSFVFYLAGFETSSTTVSFLLYELAKNPELQLKVQAEIDEVLANHDGALTYESISEMKYLEWCIDETLRKYPPLPVLTRECTEPWVLPNSGGRIIEKGTRILIPMLSLHMDPQYFAEPDVFDPMRFSPEQMDDTKTFAERPYMPFGEGPRNCIGMRLGKMQTKIALVLMLQNFKYELAGQTKVEMKLNPAAFLLTPIGGINLRVTHRKNASDGK